MKLTAQEEVYLRARPHKTKLWLSIYEPKTVFQAQLASGTFQFGETDIDYVNGTSGSYLLTYPNMTVLVGTQPGLENVGRVRLRYSTGTYVVVAENNIIWEQNQYLTFIDYVNVEAIFPRIIKDPDNDENVIFYKDDDILYSNQNSIYGTFPCAGSHRAAFLETGSVSLYYTSTGTYNVKSDSLTYDWHFEGGTPTGSTALSPGWVSYNTSGHYKTKLTVISSSGAKDTTYRYVSIYDRPEKGSNVPVLKWSLEDFSGSRGEGGYTARIKTWENLGAVEPNALVVLFADDTYGSNDVSIGGNNQNSQKIVFVGYILKDSIQFNYKDGWAEFDVGSITEVMKLSEGFSVSCESVTSPSTWFQLQEMTTAKAMYHYLRWHSTVLNVADFQYTGDDRLVEYFDTDRASLYDSVGTFVSEGLLGELVSDRQGKLWAEITPYGYEDPFDSIQDGMTIQKMDWVGEPNISIRRTADVSFVEMGGIVYEGAQTDGFQALLTNAPSSTPLYRGRSDGSKQGLILSNQTQLNKIAGNYLSFRNSKFEDVSFELAGNYRNFDIAPQEKLYLLVDGSETPEGESLLGRPFRMSSMSWNYNSEKESFYPSITLEPIVTGTAGETIIIPPFVDDSGYSYPQFQLPPFPDFNTPSEPPVQQETQYMLGIEYNEDTPFYTTNFDQQYPEWRKWRYGVDSSDRVTCPAGINSRKNMCFIAPNGAVWLMTWILVSGAYYAKQIYRAPYLGGKFEKIITPAWLEAEYGADTVNRTIQITGFGFNMDKPEEIGFIVSHTDFNSNQQMWVGNGTTWQKGTAFSYTTVVFGNLTGIDGEWTWDSIGGADEGWTVLDGDGNKLSSAFFGQGAASEHVRAGNTKTVMKWKDGTTGSEGVLRSEDNGKTTTVITVTERLYGLPNNIVSDPTGMYVMANYKNGVYRGRSYDGGYSWSVLTAMPPAGENTNFGYCGGDGSSSRWVAGTGAVYYSNNFGSTWSDKTGNLLQVFLPVPGASIRRFIPYLSQPEI